MHKIDGFGHVNGAFVAEDPGLSRPPTVVTPEWLNAVQGELVAVVQAAGLVLDKGNSAQVLAALKFIFGDGPGAVGFFARSTAPTGYMKANGAAVSRSAYAALFGAIGTTFGAGDGATTFNLPDLRGEFLRGFDDGRGVDVGRAFGSLQADEFKNHSHIQFWGQGGAGTLIPGNNIASLSIRSTVGPTGDAGGTETRPRNVALLACIKF